MRDVPSVPRPPSQSRDGIVIEVFEHAGLTVELALASVDDSPRFSDLAHVGVVACAEPYGCLSDLQNHDGEFVLVEDEALALLLADRLTEDSLASVEAHVVAIYGATVILPLYLDEGASTRTGLSLSAEPIVSSGGAAPIGVIFDCRGDHYTDDQHPAVVRAVLLEQVRNYDVYLRGDLLVSAVRDEAGHLYWDEVAHDGGLDQLRENTKRAAESHVPEAELMRAERRKAEEEDRRGW